MLTPEDLEPFATIPLHKAEAMIADALAMARVIAPCIDDPMFPHTQAVRAIMRGAVLRWAAVDTGAVTSQTAGPFSVSVDSAARRGGVFWPSEITQLQQLCREGGNGAWNYDTLPAQSVQHADVCTLNFGGQYCSCGAVLTGLAPLWENR